MLHHKQLEEKGQTGHPFYDSLLLYFILNRLCSALLCSIRLSKCRLEPCPNTVDCFISRPTEKRIFTLFMVVTSALCVLMCMCEMIYLICKRIQKVLKIRHDNERILFADRHKVTSLALPRSQYRKADPTLALSQPNLSRKEKNKEADACTTL